MVGSMHDVICMGWYGAHTLAAKDRYIQRHLLRVALYLLPGMLMVAMALGYGWPCWLLGLMGIQVVHPLMLHFACMVVLCAITWRGLSTSLSALTRLAYSEGLGQYLKNDGTLKAAYYDVATVPALDEKSPNKKDSEGLEFLKKYTVVVVPYPSRILPARYHDRWLQWAWVCYLASLPMLATYFPWIALPLWWVLPYLVQVLVMLIIDMRCDYKPC